MSVFRVVMVSFDSGTTTQDIERFGVQLKKLAETTPGLVRMVCGDTAEVGNESMLSTQAPNATYGDFASIWEFESSEFLAAFVDSPIHHAVARERFSTVVNQRYVFNLIEALG